MTSDPADATLAPGDPGSTPASGDTTDDRSTFEFVLPSLGADMDAGRVVEWRTAVGDAVHRGDVIAVVETEKSDIDVEIWHDGVVEELLVPLGTEISVGTPIARLRPIGAGSSGGDGSPSPGPRDARSRVDRVDEPATPGPSRLLDVAVGGAPAGTGPAPAEREPGGRVPASPLARRLAAERGIDLAFVVGTGPAGAVVVADIEALGERPAIEPVVLRRDRDPTDAMRALIAERMTIANREIPHYYLSQDVDLTALLGWIATENEGRPIGERLLPAALYVKATAIAAARHRELNGFWIDGRFEGGDGVNVAMAIALRRGGLVTPQIASADERSVGEIMAMLREFVTAARTGTLRTSWMTGATITLTNLGDQGADRVYGVISPPQVALVGTGAVRERAWVVDGDVAARSILTVTLAADHRATDGASGARFLATLAEALEKPAAL